MALTLGDLLGRARNRLDDLKTPYLWSDSELTDYINDTIQDAAIRASLVVEDNIPLVFTQNLDLTWNAKYALPSGYLDVRSVIMASNPYYTLTRTSIRHIELMHHGRPLVAGTPYAYALDQTKAGTGDDLGLFVRTITFIGTPIEADTAYLDVIRLPKILEDTDDVPEIDAIWHSDIIFGVTALAYLKRDAETYNPNKSDHDFALFTQRFGERIPANVLRERQTDVPMAMVVG